MSDHPHEVMPPEFIAELKRTLPEAERQLAIARKQYDLAARAGIASADMSQRIEEAQRKVTQMKAVFKI